MTKPGYVTKIKNFAGSQEGYVMMEFSSLGFISESITLHLVYFLLYLFLFIAVCFN